MLYTVKTGDSLSKIARDVVGNMSMWPTLARINNIVAPYVIQPGQTLLLPEGVEKSISFPAPASQPVSAPKIITPSGRVPLWKNKKMMAWLAVAVLGAFFLTQKR